MKSLTREYATQLVELSNQRAAAHTLTIECWREMREGKKCLCPLAALYEAVTGKSFDALFISTSGVDLPEILSSALDVPFHQITKFLELYDGAPYRNEGEFWDGESHVEFALRKMRARMD